MEDICDKCNGSGTEVAQVPKAYPRSCRKCNGAGHLTKKPDTGAKLACSDGFYAVLTFDDKGGGGIGGQTVGADGSGTYGVIFEADTMEKAENAAVEYLKKMQEEPQYYRRIKNMNIAYGEGWGGPFVKKISI